MVSSSSVRLAQRVPVLLLLLLPLLLVVGARSTRYEPTWESLDARPIPRWYDDGKVGVFMHWGVYAVPALTEWIWYNWRVGHEPSVESFIASHYRNGTQYPDFAHQFTAEDFDASHFAELVNASGARYYVVTSKHHDGFTLWPSATAWNWNAAEVGPHRDLVGELAAAFRRLNAKRNTAAGKEDEERVHFGVYFSLMDWFHPLYLGDAAVNGSRRFVTEVMGPQLAELMERYAPEVLWADGDWERPEDYWRSRQFLAWLYNDSPVRRQVVTNDRWGAGVMGNHGGFLTHEDGFDPGKLMPRKWEDSLKLDPLSWGYRRALNASILLTVPEMVAKLARSICCNGNLLVNVGPDHRGRVPPIFEDRLRRFGAFLRANAEAVYGTRAWAHQRDGDAIWYTSRLRDGAAERPSSIFHRQDEARTIVYAFILLGNLPPDATVLSLDAVRVLTNRTTVEALALSEDGGALALRVNEAPTTRCLRVDLRQLTFAAMRRVAESGANALVLRIQYAATDHHDPTEEFAVRRKWKMNSTKHRHSLRKN